MAPWRIGPGLGPLAAAVIAIAAGCGAGSSTAATSRLRVAAQPFALAEVARRVGLDRVAVSDRGDVEVDSGGDADPWLDPVAMQHVSAVVATELTRADPNGRSVYQRGAQAYTAQLAALDIDYRSSLADCARHDIVTADGAFARLGRRYGFDDHAATEAGVVDTIGAMGITAVFREPGVATGPVDAVAWATGARTDVLDTMQIRTPAETARGASYLSLMTDNLAKLRAALACASS